MNGPRLVQVRQMTDDDIEAGLRLCRQSRWNQVDRDWRQFLAVTPGGAAVAVDEAGALVGSVATIRYAAATSQTAGTPSADNRATPSTPPRSPQTHDDAAHSVAWIAMVLVDTNCRGGGIGTTLLQHGLHLLNDVPVVGLDATPLGQPLYQKLGFRSDARFVRMQRAAMAPGSAAAIGATQLPHLQPPLRPHAPRPRPATTADLDAIVTLDSTATGLDRRAMLSWLLQGAPELAWVVDGTRGLEGAVLGRHGHDASHLGPVIATTPDVALDLVDVCLRTQPSLALFVDAAEDRPGWRANLEALGFEPQRPFTRMYRGATPPAGDATRLFAIIGAEFG